MKTIDDSKYSEISGKMNLQTKIFRIIWFSVFFGSIMYVNFFNTTISFFDLLRWLLFWVGTGSFAGGVLGILTKQITLKGYTHEGAKAVRFGIFYIIFGIFICLIPILYK